MELYVKTFGDKILAMGSVVMNELVEAARDGKAPLLGSVDEYDDTIFNRSQVSLILIELEDLKLPPSHGLAQSELIKMAKLMEDTVHTYLVFNGD